MERTIREACLMGRSSSSRFRLAEMPKKPQPRARKNNNLSTDGQWHSRIDPAVPLRHLLEPSILVALATCPQLCVDAGDSRVRKAVLVPVIGGRLAHLCSL